MRQHRYLLGSVVIGWLLVAAAEAQLFDPELPGQQTIVEGSEPMPEKIEIWEDRRYPWFVALEKVFLPSGEFDDTFASVDLIENGPTVLSAFEKRRPDGCADLTVLSSMDEHAMLGFSLAESVANAESVIIVRVTGQRVGVQDTFIGSAFRLETAEVLKGAGPLPRTNYVFLRGGEARVWGERVCSTNPFSGDLPAVGEEAVVLLGPGIRNREKGGLVVNPSDVVPLRSEVVRLGLPYRRDEGLAASSGLEFLAKVKQLLHRHGDDLDMG